MAPPSRVASAKSSFAAAAVLARHAAHVRRAHPRIDVHPPEEGIAGAQADEALEVEDDAALDRYGAPGEAVPPARRTSGTSWSWYHAGAPATSSTVSGRTTAAA
jgi:hypothetical protein